VDWPKCQASVSNLISPNDIDVQRKAIGSLLVLEDAILGSLGFFIAIWRLAAYGNEPVGAILHIHIPSSDFAQLQSGVNKRTAIFLTATNDANAPTVIVTPTPLPS
jgi:hypothetical protein